MARDYIDFISSYCDRWCERCAFTSRCSAYAVDIATAMCDGDVAAGLELAVGAPPPDSVAEAARREASLQHLSDAQPSAAELEQCAREQEQREERVDESPITTSATKTTTLAVSWLRTHREHASRTSDPQLEAAIEIAGWDSYFIEAKLHRALDGRDQYLHDSECDDHPIQNDWNGSAKVALISIVRSADAWQTIGRVMADTEALAVAAELRRLQREVEQTFPDAWRFKRPGFDDRPRWRVGPR